MPADNTDAIRAEPYVRPSEKVRRVRRKPTGSAKPIIPEDVPEIGVSEEVEHDLGPEHSAGYLVRWYVPVGWQSNEITLCNLSENASAAAAVAAQEKFEIWELDGKRAALRGKFQAVAITGDTMRVCRVNG
jgi:hypothetical protein